MLRSIIAIVLVCFISIAAIGQEQERPRLGVMLLTVVEANQSLDQVIQDAFAEMAKGKMSKRQALYLFLDLKQDAEKILDQLVGLSLEPEWQTEKSAEIVHDLWYEQNVRLTFLCKACGLEADAGSAKAKPAWAAYYQLLKRYGAVKTKAYSLWYRGGED